MSYDDNRTEREFARLINKGDQRTPAELRRTAELYEHFADPVEAVTWWRRAAEAGDPDAIVYVAEFAPAQPAIAASS